MLPVLLAALAQHEGAPPARALLLELTEQTRLAGTRGSQLAAERCAEHLRQAGFTVEIDKREVVQALPLSIELRATDGGRTVLERWSSFQPDAIPAGDVPLVNGGTKSGRVQGRVIDVGRGLREDYERLAAEGVDTRNCIALARYGGAYRGVKVDLAAAHGCVGVLLWNDPARDGFERGTPWPLGQWKPAHEAERGSVTPIGRNPGDPSTPQGASGAPRATTERLTGEALERTLSRIPCIPISASEGRELLARAATATVEFEVQAPPRLVVLHNVIARLDGSSDLLVLAGNHRDAWVRGANDAASGTVALLRAAQILGARAQAGWKPAHDIGIALWDGEEFGLVGSTEWAEAHADGLRQRLLTYINMDVGVSGVRFGGADGTPGLLGTLRAALERVPAAPAEGMPSGSLWDEWQAASSKQSPARTPRLDLPGSGSDFTVFLHHLSLPVLDLGLSGNGGGQYHTAFDDLPIVERHLDPGYVGHELAARLMSELLSEFTMRGEESFAAAEAARDLGDRTQTAAQELSSDETKADLRAAFTTLSAAWMTAGERLHTRALSGNALSGRQFYATLAAPIEGRPWFRNTIWAPGLELGYGSELYPTLRAAARVSPDALEAETARLVERIGLLGKS